MISLADLVHDIELADLIELKAKNARTPFREQMMKLNLQASGRLFALVVYYSDGHLQFKEETEFRQLIRFMIIASRLPLDVQMILCLRVFGSTKTIISTQYSEPAFKRYAKDLKMWHLSFMPT